jgi:anti-sigma regulatory factor (Ser/Thr protein kinase)
LAQSVEDEYRWLTLPALDESLDAFQAFAREGARSAGLPPATLWKLELAVEEALVNVFRYGYPPGQSGACHLGWLVTGAGKLSISVRDSGRPFDPLARESPDTSAKLEDRPIGGLGIFLLRQVAHDVRYRRAGEVNELTFAIGS